MLRIRLIPLWEGKIEWHDEIAKAEVKNARAVVPKGQVKVSTRAEAVEHLLGALWDGKTRAITSPDEIAVVGHRVVHGGPKYKEPILVTPEVKAGIAGVSAFAPLHNRAELEGMEVIEKRLGAIPQVAVFDTGFHRKMPQAAAVYPGDLQWHFGQGGFSCCVGFDILEGCSRAEGVDKQVCC